MSWIDSGRYGTHMLFESNIYIISRNKSRVRMNEVIVPWVKDVWDTHKLGDMKKYHPSSCPRR